MSSLSTTGARATPGLPPTNGVQDKQARAWMDAMTQSWAVRNNGEGSVDEQFVRKGDVAGLASAAVVQLLTGPSGASPNPTVGGIPNVQAVINQVLGSKVVEYLRTPNVVTLPISNLQKAVDSVRSSVVDLNTKVDALEAVGGDAAALVATEASARVTGDSVNASLITVVQSAIYQSMVTGPNLVQNPGFAPGVPGWDPSVLEAATTSGVPANAPSDYVLRHAGRDIVNAPLLRVNQGEVLDSTVWIAAGSGATTTDCGILAECYSTDGVTVLSFQPLVIVAAGFSGSWTLFSGSWTVPAGVGYIKIDLDINQASSGGPNVVYFSQPVVGRRTGVGYVSMASILNEQTTRANKDNALAQALNTVWSEIGGSDALIQDGALAAISPAAVAATKWNSVVASVTDPNTGQVNSASIKQELTTYASLVDGSLNATYGLKVNVNGAVSGFALMASAGAGSAPGTASSTFAILADRLSLISPTNASVLPFTVDSLGNAIFNGWIYAAGGTFAGALSAATGSIGAITVATTGYLRGGQTDYNTGTGFFIGNSGGQYKFSIGSPAGPYMLWDGSSLLLSKPTMDTFTASISGGDLVLDAFPYLSSGAQVYGSRTAVASGGKSPYTYTWFLNLGGTNSSAYPISQCWISAGTSLSATVTIAGTGDTMVNYARAICLVQDANGRVTVASFHVQAHHASGTAGGGGGDAP